MGKEIYTYDTADTILTMHRKEVGDDIDTSIEFMDQTSLLFAFNQFKRDILNCPFSGLQLDPEGKITINPTNKGWDFKLADKPFTFTTKVALAGPIAAGSVGNVDMTNTTGWDAANGAFIAYDINQTWDFITYALLAGVTCQTLANVGFAHASGEEVNRLYQLPSDFARAKSLSVRGYPLIEGDQDPDRDHFCVYNGFLWMPRNFGSTTGTLQYWQQPVDVTDSTLKIDVPNTLSSALLHMMNARAFTLGGSEREEIYTEWRQAANDINKALGYSVATSNTMIKLKRRPPQSPTYPFGGLRTSNFDDGNYTNSPH